MREPKSTMLQRLDAKMDRTGSRLDPMLGVGTRGGGMHSHAEHGNEKNRSTSLLGDTGTLGLSVYPDIHHLEETGNASQIIKD